MRTRSPGWMRPSLAHSSHSRGIVAAVVQPVEEARALLSDVEARDRSQAQLLLEEGAAAGELVVGGHRREDHHVHLVRTHPRGLEGLGRGGGAKVGGGDVRGREVPRLDAAALADPRLPTPWLPP